MQSHINLATKLLGAAAFLTALSAAGPAVAVTSDTFTYTTVKTGYLSISPGAMIPDGFNMNYENSWSTGVRNAGKPGDPTICLNTGVQLPHGAKITGIRVWYSNNPKSESSSFDLRRQMLATNAIVSLKQLSGKDPSNNRVSVYAAVPAVVVNSALSTYMFGACLSAGDAFSGAAITYTYTTAGN